MQQRTYDHVNKKWVDHGNSQKPEESLVEVLKDDDEVMVIATSEDSVEDLPFKYCEQQICSDLENYLFSTYGEHYVKEDSQIECFDAWIALGDSGPTFRNTAIKYLWRYGKKGGKNQKDLWKAMHYIQMMMYVEHYRGDQNGS